MARRRAPVRIAAVGIAILSAALFVVGLVSYGLTLWTLVIGLTYATAAIVLLVQLTLRPSPPSPARGTRSGGAALVTACVLLLLGWLVSRGHHETAATSPDGRYTAVVDSPFEVMEVVQRIRVLDSRWTLRLPVLSICSQSADYPMRLRWDGNSLHVTYRGGQVLATVEVGEDGSARLLPTEWFGVC